MRRFSLATIVRSASTRMACASMVPRAAPEDFAVMAWSWVSDDAECTSRDPGMRIQPRAGFVAPKSLDAVAAAGLKAIVSDGATMSATTRRIAPHKRSWRKPVR